MPNDFYTPTGNPTDNSAIVSTDMRAEFAAINAGFNKLPGLTGNANKLVVINSSGTGMDVTVAPAGLTSINKIALTQPATGATFTLLDGKTLTVNKSLTLDGTDGTTMTFPATSASVARIDAAQTFTGIQDFNGRIDANAGLAVTGANFTSRGFSDNATAVALTLSGSGANSVTIANSATVPVISTTAGSLFLTSVGQNVGLLVSGGAPSGFVGLTAGGTTPAGMVISGDIIALYGQGAEQVRITGTVGATRFITMTGSNGGNPTIGTSAGSLALSSVINYIGTGSTDYGALYGGTGAFTVQAAGGSANVALQLIAKGTGVITLGSLTETQVAVINAASANRYVTLTGSNGGNPTIGTSAGDLNIASATGYSRNTAAATSIIYSIGTAGSGTFVAHGAAGQVAAYQMLINGAETGRVYSNSDGVMIGTGATATPQVYITHTASANRYVTLTGSNGGNPTIGTSAGSLALSAAVVAASTVTVGTNLFANGYVQVNSDDATPAGGAVNTGLFFGSSAIGIYFGSDAPTVSAAQGSLYIRTNGGASTRLYSNNNGTTGWSAITSA